MKKFSWIFALILALSIGFIGCPAADDDDGGGGGGGSGGGGYTKNPGAQNITITFGSTAGKTALKKNGDNNGPIDPGTVNYLADGYEYVYATGSNTNYGNSVLRFKVNLGDYVLADYGKVSFDWQATAPSVYDNSNSVNSNKRLYLYATDTEGDITPYVEAKNLVVSNINRSLDWYAPGQGDAGVPLVSGITKQHVEMPINYEERLKFLGDGADVWLAIYVHAESGTYQITNFKLWAGDQTVTPTVTGPSLPPAPPEKALIPNTYQEIKLDLSTYVTTGEGAGGATYIPAGSVSLSAGKVTATFTGSNERLVFPLSTTQQTTFASANSNDVYIVIDASITSTEGTGDKFRYHVGDQSLGGSWNATSNDLQFGLADLTIDPVADAGKGIKLNANEKGRGKSLILNHRLAESITIQIRAISIWVAPAPTAPAKSVTFTDGDVIGVNGTVQIEAGGNGFTFTQAEGTTQTGLDYEHSFAYFKVKFADTYKLSDYTGVNYKITGSAGQNEGDGGYKGFFWAGYKLLTDIPDGPTGVGTGETLSSTTGWSTAGIGNLDEEATRQVAFDVTARIAAIDGNEVWIAVRTAAKTGFVYKITDISFY